MFNNSTGLKELSVKRFIEMLEKDYKNGDITDDQYRYFKYELEIDNLDYKYELEVIKEYEPKLYRAVTNIFKDSYEYTIKYKEFCENRK